MINKPIGGLMGRKTRIIIDKTCQIPFSWMVMRICLVVSLLLHVILILAIQKAFPVNWINNPLRTYHVELLRPPIDHLAAQEITGAGLDSLIPPETRPDKELEETISLDTEDKRYWSYVKIIKTRLSNNWKYPQEAWGNLIEGKVMVMFRLTRQGHLINVEILQPSGFTVLDNEAARAIRASAPFPSFPDSVTATRLNIGVNFSYQIAVRQ